MNDFITNILIECFALALLYGKCVVLVWGKILLNWYESVATNERSCMYNLKQGWQHFTQKSYNNFRFRVNLETGII